MDIKSSPLLDLLSNYHGIQIQYHSHWLNIVAILLLSLERIVYQYPLMFQGVLVAERMLRLNRGRQYVTSRQVLGLPFGLGQKAF